MVCLTEPGYELSTIPIIEDAACIWRESIKRDLCYCLLSFVFIDIMIHDVCMYSMHVCYYAITVVSDSKIGANVIST